MSMSIKKRLALGAGAVATVGAVATLVAGVTFGLFSSTPGSETNNFTAGTVTLSSDATGHCNIAQVMPGDSGTCTFVATYSGDAPAFVALDTSLSGTGLYDGGAAGLQLSVADDNSTAYALSGTNLYVGADAAAPANTVHTFTVTWSFPDAGTANNPYQGKTTTLTMTAHAVQQKNNGTGCVTLGVACGTITSWS
jgi:hypothetical protein